MGDEGTGDGFNPCECIWNHEMAMRRLLNVLRNTQALCTDTECFETGSTPPPRNAQPENLYFMTFLIAVALFLYFFRATRQSSETITKPVNRNNSNDTPPTPPSVN